MVMRFVGSFVVVAAIGFAAIGCKNKTSDGGGGNPLAPGAGSRYISPNPNTVNVQVRMGDQRTLSGRELKVSMFEFEPGQNVSLAGKEEISVSIKGASTDTAPCDCQFWVELYAAETADGPLERTPFWDGVYRVSVGGAEGTRRIRVPNKGGVRVKHVAAKIWAIQGQADDAQTSMPAHATLVSNDLVNWDR